MAIFTITATSPTATGGHRSLDDALDNALDNAAEQLDFCSVTGHAYWPDIPEPTPETADLVAFHREGFARLEHGWAEVRKKMKDADREGRFATFPGYEVHSSAHADYTDFCRGFDEEIIY